MKTYKFDIILKDLTEVTDNQAAALFAANCDDATPVSCNGLAWIHFNPPAFSLKEAIRSALEQVQTAGLSQPATVHSGQSLDLLVA